jgi:hypothetical protein
LTVAMIGICVRQCLDGLCEGFSPSCPARKSVGQGGGKRALVPRAYLGG